MLRETAIISTWILLISVYFARNNLYNYYEIIQRDYFNIQPSDRVITQSTLSRHNGVDNKLLYLSIMGNVFDVTSGSKHYGPGEAYNFFVGKDATRNFVDGDFECKKNCDDVTGFTGQQLRGLQNWLKFYKDSYTFVGKLVGKYYDAEGNRTPYGKEIEKLVVKALKEETKQDKLKLRYPECNMEWDLERGTHVWCSDQSGGIKRNWIGVPRKYFTPGSKDFRCACVNSNDLNSPNIKEYNDCAPSSHECYFK